MTDPRADGSGGQHFDPKPSPLRVLGRARVRPDCTHLRPGLRPGQWYSVVDRNPNLYLASEIRPPLPGYVYLDVPGQGGHIMAAHFELELDPEA